MESDPLRLPYSYLQIYILKCFNKTIWSHVSKSSTLFHSLGSSGYMVLDRKWPFPCHYENLACGTSTHVLIDQSALCVMSTSCWPLHFLRHCFLIPILSWVEQRAEVDLFFTSCEMNPWPPNHANGVSHILLQMKQTVKGDVVHITAVAFTS